jgi:hypothetical protein
MNDSNKEEVFQLGHEYLYTIDSNGAAYKSPTRVIIPQNSKIYNIIKTINYARK